MRSFYLDELAVGFCVKAGLVWVILQREFFEGSVDLFCGCGVWHAEGVVVSRHGGICYGDKVEELSNTLYIGHTP